MAKQPAKRAPSPRKRSALVLWSSVIALGMLIFALPTVILLVCGMLPTMVAFVIDRQKERYATFCVASMNVCGVFPYLLDLWVGEHSLIAAVGILTNVFSLFIIFGAAAFGWVIFTTVPPVISSFMGVIAQSRVTALRGDQRKLIDEWGDSVRKKVVKSAAPQGTENTKQSKDKSAKATPGGGAASPGAAQPLGTPDSPKPDEQKRIDPPPDSDEASNGNGQTMQSAQSTP